MSAAQQFDNVSVVCKANVYFDGKVVSHSVLFPGGSRKTLGVIHPGAFTFNTDAPETMAIVAGSCRVTLKGETTAKDYAAGASFRVPGKSAFEINVASGLCEYVCSFE